MKTKHFDINVCFLVLHLVSGVLKKEMSRLYNIRVLVQLKVRSMTE